MGASKYFSGFGEAVQDQVCSAALWLRQVVGSPFKGYPGEGFYCMEICIGFSLFMETAMFQTIEETVMGR